MDKNVGLEVTQPERDKPLHSASDHGADDLHIRSYLACTEIAPADRTGFRAGGIPLRRHAAGFAHAAVGAFYLGEQAQQPQQLPSMDFFERRSPCYHAFVPISLLGSCSFK